VTDGEPEPKRGQALSTLRGQLVAMVALVALASVLVTGATMIGLFRQGATAAAQSALSRDADTVAGTLTGFSNLNARRQVIRSTAVNQQLAKRQITSVITGPEGASSGELPAPFLASDLTGSLASGSISLRRTTDGRQWLVEGRSIGAGVDAVLLAQPLDSAVSQRSTPYARLLLSVLVGLAVGGLAGGLMARRLGRPLSALAATARRLSAGERDVEAPARGPAEVADVGRALNDLAVALTGSEARQRRFLADVSHELRTPLTAVTGYAEGLADGTLTGDAVVPAGQVIQAEAARLRRRVEDLLALARMEADNFRLEPAQADLNELIRAAGLAWQPRADAVGVTLQVSLPSRPVVVRTDAERVRQAVDALADNALRVLSAGHRLGFDCGQDSDVAWVRVSDDGPGLGPDDLEVAFERGRLTERYRGDRPVGSGLGLALVGELARKLGGRAVAEPRDGQGVSFAVLLPGSPEPAADPV
jgi:two-component system OmpR family sensor kinase